MLDVTLEAKTPPPPPDSPRGGSGEGLTPFRGQVASTAECLPQTAESMPNYDMLDADKLESQALCEVFAA